MLRGTVQCLVFVQLLSIVIAQVTFTGDAGADFALDNLPTEYAKKAYLRIDDEQTIALPPALANNGWISGWDVKTIYAQYDYLTDRLFVGVDCFSICGDAEGDGDPGTTPPGPDYAGSKDWPDYSGPETICIWFWPEPPASYVPYDTRSDAYLNFYPTFVVGIKAGSGNKNLTTNFDSYGWILDTSNGCTTAPFEAGSDCEIQNSNTFANPSSYFGLSISTFAGKGRFTFTKPITKPKLFASPSAAHPDIEFILYNFSNYHNFSFNPGYDPIRFAMALYQGSSSDIVGEENIIPKVFAVPCAFQDACGVCDGDNSTCVDCAYIPNGNTQYDVCGVCGGDNTSCWDCLKVPNGNAQLDACNVCDGDNSTCKDCFGVVHGSSKYDACGVCGGDNTTCWDCAGVPNGKKVYDHCGVCGGTSVLCGCNFDSIITLEADDTYIALQERTENFGRSINLLVSSYKERTALRFNDIRYKLYQTALTTNAFILKATLRLYVRGIVRNNQGWELDNDIAVHNLYNNFNEDKATWECRDVDDTGCCVTWRMLPLYPKVQPDYEWEPVATQKVVDRLQGWLEFNVTADIVDWFENSYLNAKSYLIKKVCEKEPGYIAFWSCEGGRCPELEITLRSTCREEPQEPEEPACPETGMTWGH